MEIKALVSQMTLEEKAGLCSGLDFWHTKSVERLGVPSVMVSDGPHGLRKQDDKGDHLGINDSIKAVCMPAASATAASFDRDLIRKMGEAIGDSCQHEKLSVVLGPAVNIKRSPLCGRNFEYFSEDPYLAGEMSAAYINGVQSRNVGTSIKHFAANNQEHRRMSSSSNADERTLREIYFPAFETSVKKAQPWTVMCSYNRINGVYASENPWLLTDVLRKEWGFEGYVMSDWARFPTVLPALPPGWIWKCLLPAVSMMPGSWKRFAAASWTKSWWIRRWSGFSPSTSATWKTRNPKLPGIWKPSTF